MADTNRPLDIVVVGGSLAALMCSVSILSSPPPPYKSRHKVTILERNPTPLLHSSGAGIVAGAETLEWFRRFDRSLRAKPEGMSVLSGERLYLDRDGNVIDQERREQRMTSWEVVYYAGRAEFDGLRTGYAANDGFEIIKDPAESDAQKQTGLTREWHGTDAARYIQGCTLTGFEERGNKALVVFQQGDRHTTTPQEASIEADLVICADGPSSTARTLLLGANAGQRDYAGYVAFRGTATEPELSEGTASVFVEKFTFFHGNNPNTQILGYTIPGDDGLVAKGKRLVNWVWYWNIDQQSTEWEELMTDSEGKKHRLTLPTGGKMQPHVWDHWRQVARQHLPPQFYELIAKTEKPFVQAITDLKPPSAHTPVARLLNGKAILVGDALSGFRPHTAASTSQAALHALLLEKVFQNEMTWVDYEKTVLDFAHRVQNHGVMLGDRSQFGHHPLASS